MKLAIKQRHRKLYRFLRYSIVEPFYDTMDKILPYFAQDFYPFKEFGYKPAYKFPSKNWWEGGLCSYEIKYRIREVKEAFYHKLQTKTGKRLLNWFINNNCSKLLAYDGINAEIRNREKIVSYYNMSVFCNYCKITKTRYITEDSEGANIFLTAILSLNSEDSPKVTTSTETVFKGFLTKRGLFKVVRAFVEAYDGTIFKK